MVGADDPRRLVDDDAGAGVADRRDHGDGDLGVPGGQVALAGAQVAKVDVDDAGAFVDRATRLARHFLRRHRGGIDRGVGQHPGQRAGDDGLVQLTSPAA